MIVFDILLTLMHIGVIGFNLTGWIWKRTRKLHRIVVLLTVFSWIGLGFWKGFGYCVLTDWHWAVKESLGKKELPNSFIKYAVDTISGKSVDAGLIDQITAITFMVIVIITIFYCFRDIQTLRNQRMINSPDNHRHSHE